MAGLAGWGASLVAPHPLAAAVAFGTAIVLTGAIHVDGFLDSCDGILATVAPERRLEILKDPRHGTYAVAGFAVVAILWIAALASIAPAQLPWAMAFAGGGARFAAVLNAYWYPYGPGGSAAAAFEARPSRPILAGTLLVAVACAWLAPYWIPLIALAMLGSLGIGGFAARRLGGSLTGDVYGAAVVVLDVLLLAGIAVLGPAR